VMTFRSSGTPRVGAPSGVAHSPQNLWPSGFSWPHEGHAVTAGAYANTMTNVADRHAHRWALSSSS
jgi:hypothetical protein